MTPPPERPRREYLDKDHVDRLRDAIAEARLGGLDPYDPLPEDLPDWWHADDD